MSESGRDSHRRSAVLRTPVGWALPIVGWVVCLFFAANLVLTGTPHIVLQYLPWLVFAAWVLYLFFWRPCLIVKADRMRVVNLIREHRIPFGAVLSYRVLQTVTIETTAGRIASWGAPGITKLDSRARRRPAIGTTQLPAVPRSQQALDEAMADWHEAGGVSDDEPVTTAWALPELIVGAVLLIIGLVVAFV